MKRFLVISNGPLPFALLLCLTAAIVALTLFIGSGHINVFGWDTLGLLDGGWRIYSGQRVYHDFLASPAGAMEDLRNAANLWLGRGELKGVGYGNAILAAIFGLGGFALLRQRMNRAIAMLASVTLALLVASPSPMGALVVEYSRAMEYNRLGYALLALLILEMFQPPLDSAGIGGSICSGVILGILPLHKPTYFLIAITYVAAAVLLGWVTRRKLAWIAAASIATFAIVWMILQPGAALIAGFAGLRGSAQAEMRLDAVRTLGKMVLWQADFWALLVGGVFAGILGKNSWRDAALGALTFFAGIGLLITNSQTSGLPLTGIVLLIFASRTLINMPENRQLAAATVLWALVYWSAPPAKDAMSLVLAAKESRDHAASTEKLAAIAGRQQVIEGYTPWIDFVNDGLRLAARETKPGECIAAVSYVNPFSYALGHPPCRGGRSFLDTTSFPNLWDIPQDQLIGANPDILMVPKPGSSFWVRNDRNLVPRFAELIAKSYEPAGESDWWRVYRPTTPRAVR